MAKKLIRITPPSSRDLEKYMNTDISVVLKNKSVYLGKIKIVKLDEIIFSDNLFNKRVFKINEISEIILDEPHSF